MFAQGNDAFAGAIGFGCGVWPFGRGEEKWSVWILSEAVEQDAEACGGIAEALGSLSGGESVNEVGTEGFVESLVGVGG